MSIHSNSALHGDSMLELLPEPMTKNRYETLHSGVTANRAPQSFRKIARPPEEIWGQFNNYRSNGVVVSAIVHAVAVALLLSGVFFGHQVVARVAPKETVTLIAPSPDT